MGNAFLYYTSLGHLLGKKTKWGGLRTSNSSLKGYFLPSNKKISILTPAMSVSPDNYKQYSLCPLYYSIHEDKDLENSVSDT